MEATTLPPGARWAVAVPPLCAALLALTGCDRGSTPENDPDDGGVLTAPTNPVSDGHDDVVAAYDEFWVRTHEVPHQPEPSWDESMAEVATGEQLEITLQLMRFHQEQGTTSYGEVVSRISDVDIDGDEATVVDCQDASNSGQADAETGEPQTVGVERNPVEARMELDSGRWKVAEITYPDGEC